MQNAHRQRQIQSPICNQISGQKAKLLKCFFPICKMASLFPYHCKTQKYICHVPEKWWVPKRILNFIVMKFKTFLFLLSYINNTQLKIDPACHLKKMNLGFKQLGAYLDLHFLYILSIKLLYRPSRTIYSLICLIHLVLSIQSNK